MKASSGGGRRGAPHLPARVLKELRRGQISPESFAAVLDAFGELPEEGQYDLAVRIINASTIYELRKLVEPQFPLPHEHQSRLKRISTSAKRLLALLGINDAKSVARGIYPRVQIRINKATTPPTVTTDPAELPPQVTIHPTATLLSTWLYRVAVDRRPATANVGAGERLFSLIMLLSDLVEAAERWGLETGGHRRGRGGDRRAGQITAEVAFMQALMESYAALRSSFPNSGPQPAFDERLLKFVRSGLMLVVSASRFVDSHLAKLTRTTDAAIRGAFNRWRAQIKAKPQIDLNISQK
jgi:hypothetical protein